MLSWTESSPFQLALFRPLSTSNTSEVTIDMDAIANSLDLLDRDVQVKDLTKQMDGPRWSLRQWLHYWRGRKRKEVSSVAASGPGIGASVPNHSVIGGFHGDLIAADGSGGSLSLKNGADDDSDLDDEADSAIMKANQDGKCGIRGSSFARVLGLSCLSLSSFYKPSGRSYVQHDDCVTSKSKTHPNSPLLPPSLLIPKELHETNLLTTLGLTRYAQQHKLRHFISLYPSQTFVNFHINGGGATCWIKLLKGSVSAILVPPLEPNLSLFCSWIKSGAKDKGFSFLEASLKDVKVASVDQGSQLIIPGGYMTCFLINSDSLLVNSQFLHPRNLPLQFYAWSSEELLRSPQSLRYPYFLQTMWLLASSIVGPINYAPVESRLPQRPFPCISKSTKRKSAPQTRDDISDFVVSGNESYGQVSFENEDLESEVKQAAKSKVPQWDGAGDALTDQDEDASFLFAIHASSNFRPNDYEQDQGRRTTPSLFPFTSLLGISISSANHIVDPSPPSILGVGEGVVAATSNAIKKPSLTVKAVGASIQSKPIAKGEKAPDPSVIELTTLGLGRNRSKAPPSLTSKSPLPQGSLLHSRSHLLPPNPSPAVSGSLSLPASHRVNFPSSKISLSESAVSSLYSFLRDSLKHQDGPYFSGVPLSIRKPQLLLEFLSLKVSSNVVALQAPSLAPLLSIPLCWQALFRFSEAIAPQGHSPCPSGADGATLTLGEPCLAWPLHLEQEPSSRQELILDEDVSSNDLEDWQPMGRSVGDKRDSKTLTWQKRLKI